MPESIVQVTEGSGKKLHTFQRTIGANTVEDEVTIQGEQHLATYNLWATGISWATINSHIVQLMAGAALNVYVRSIRLFQTGLATAAALATWELRRLTTAGTGGGALSVPALDSVDAAAGAAGMSLPAVKGTEGVVLYTGSVALIQTMGASAPAAPWPLLVEVDFEKLRGKALRIPAGVANGIALKNFGAGVAAATVAVNVVFAEANF